MKTPARFVLIASIGATLATAQEPASPPPAPAPPAAPAPSPAPVPTPPGETRRGLEEPRREGRPDFDAPRRDADRPRGEAERSSGDRDRFRRPEDRPDGDRPVDRPRAEGGERGRQEGERPRLDGERPRVEVERRRVEGERRIEEGGPRGEGTTRPNARPGVPGEDGGARRNFIARMPEKPQPYLGIVTRDAGPELTSQLRQPEGFGLIVEEVLPDSPAKSAGLERNDLIIKFEDQLLANPPQLEALVRRAGKDKEANLTIIRGGAEQKVTLKIGEKMLPERRPLPGFYPGRPQLQFQPAEGRMDPQPRRLPNREGENPSRDSGERGARYLRDHARIARNDEDGTFELRSAGGTRMFSVQKPNGEAAWQGPVGTQAERDAVPTEWRKKLELLERDINAARPPGDRAPGDRAPADRPPEPARR